METVQVHMFGRFSIETEQGGIDDAENRAQKPRLMLSYLLYHHDRVVTQDELLRLCWDSEEIRGDPANALRVVLHRARTMLDRLGLLPGRELIVRSREGFVWNERVPVRLDVNKFERLYQRGRAAKDPEERRSCFERAMELYTGHFLGRNRAEGWVRCMAERFRAVYREMALETLTLIPDAGEAERLCRAVLRVEPSYEPVCRRLMEALLEQGREQDAAVFYENLRKQLMEEGRLPEEETAAVYFRVIRRLNPSVVPMELHRSEAERQEGGARVCDFAFFRMFYSSAEWMILQCGLNVYHVLFTMEARGEKFMSERTWERLMEELIEQLRCQLKTGNVISRCAPRQIVGMMGADGYEAACMICERQVEKFYREHPSAPVSLRYGAWRVGGER